jgi:hypothetical protein
MVDLMGVPKCENNTAVVWLILAILVPGLGQIIAGASNNHVDSILIGVSIIILFFVLTFASYFVVVLITIFTFGFGIFLAALIPLALIFPWIWSIYWVSLSEFLILLKGCEMCQTK